MLSANLNSHHKEVIQCHCRDLTSKLKFVDPDRVAVYGEGVGGWLAGSVLARDRQALAPVIKCAILQSPVADWSLHGKSGQKFNSLSMSQYFLCYIVHSMIYIGSFILYNNRG